MNPFGWIISQGEQVLLDEANGFYFGETLFPGVVTAIPGELETSIGGTSTVTGRLLQINELDAQIAGGSFVFSRDVGGGLAGFEIPYLLGRTQGSFDLAVQIVGRSTIAARLLQINALRSIVAGTSTITASLSVFGSQNMQAIIAGRTTITAELYVDAIRELTATINGTSSVVANLFMAGIGVDPRSQSYLYLLLNVGVGFDPIDTYPGATQTFPDGHNRDDFSRYLYALLNVGAGFDPTDDVSSRPDFVSQTFPDGHTAFDFHEYLYLYLNVVLGLYGLGQLVIRPGFTRGPILPQGKPPRLEPT